MAESPSKAADPTGGDVNADCADRNKISTEADGGELDDLLDSALEDFDKPARVPPTQSAPAVEVSNDKPAQATNSNKEQAEATLPNQEALFNELFNNAGSGEAAADFQNALGDLMAELGKEFTQDPQFNDELSQLLQTTIPPGAMPQPSSSPSSSTSRAPPSSGSHTASPGPAASSNTEDDISRTLGETMDRLSQNAQDLQQDTGIPGIPGMPADFMRAFEGMNMGDIGGGSGDADLVPMMQGIMQNLLCKEVLYPSLKEVVGKYPQWLTENKETLSESDYSRYSKQLDIMQRLCAEYETETDSDSQDVKQQRTMKVMDLIQQMEVLGQPPKEIIGDVGPGLPGMMPGMMPGLEGMPGADQCSIM